MNHSPIALTGRAQRLGARWSKPLLLLRALYLGRPGLITKILAVVAFFSIGVV